ncbi:hypothetical protein B5P43_33880 [Bacillus sp. SRB_336]|nr:hypothetical protein B5P43_33880 [Bacillus sp. SRB_336]
MRRLFAIGGAAALFAASSAGLAAPAFATPDPAACLTDCTVTFTPSDGQATWVVPSHAVDVRLTVAGGSGSIYEGTRGGAGGSGGTVSTDVGSAYDGQVLHVLAGAAGTGGQSGFPPFSEGGDGSYVAVSGQFLAVAGGGGGGGMQVSSVDDGSGPPAPGGPQVNLAGGAGGFSGTTPSGGAGEDSKNAQAYGTGAAGASPGTGSWAPPAGGRTSMDGGPGTVAGVAADGTITPGVGGGWAYTGGAYSGAAEGGGGYAGGGGGSGVGQQTVNPDASILFASTEGAGGGGSGFLAAGLTALSTGPNAGDGHVTITYSIGPAPTAPDAPTGLTAVPEPGSDSVVLSLTEPANNGGAAILGYPLQRSTDGIHWADLGEVADFGNGTFHDYGLALGTIYHYRLAAENIAGTGPHSPAISVLAQSYPRYVKDLVARADTHRATLTWAYPLDDGGTPVTGYQVQYVATESSPVTVPDARWTDAPPPATSPFAVDGLTNDTMYAFRVRPVNAQGPSPEWQYVQAVPAAPQFIFTPKITVANGAALHNSTVVPGTTITISQAGLPVGAKLTATLQHGGAVTGTVHAPLVLDYKGTATVGSDGTVRLSLRIPAGAPAGDYALTTELTDAGRTVIPYTAYFTVAAAGSPAAGTGTDPGTGLAPGTEKGTVAIPDNGAGSGGRAADRVGARSSSAPAPAHKGGLAFTGGAFPSWIVPAGALLLLTGLALVLASRRRNA